MASHVSLLVTGSRNARNKAPLWLALDRATLEHDSYSLFVGCARGADAMARDWWHERNPLHKLTSPAPLVEQFTSAHDYPPGQNRLCVFHADWTGEGRLAGPRRNWRMIQAWNEQAGEHHAIAYWTAEVKGSGTLDAMCKIVKLRRGIEVIPCA
jgi:hypothetical protein